MLIYKKNCYWSVWKIRIWCFQNSIFGNTTTLGICKPYKQQWLDRVILMANGVQDEVIFSKYRVNKTVY